MNAISFKENYKDMMLAVRDDPFINEDRAALVDFLRLHKRFRSACLLKDWNPQERSYLGCPIEFAAAGKHYLDSPRCSVYYFFTLLAGEQTTQEEFNKVAGELGIGIRKELSRFVVLKDQEVLCWVGKRKNNGKKNASRFCEAYYVNVQTA